MAHFCAAATGPPGRSAWCIIPPPLTHGESYRSTWTNPRQPRPCSRDREACGPLPSPATGLPRLPVSPSLRAVPSTPADRNGCIRRLLPRSTRPSPNLRRVGVHIFTFEACSGFTRVRPARSLNRPRRPLSQGFGPAGYPTRPPVSYQIKPTTVWVDPSSTGVTRRRGALRNPGSRAERVLVGPSCRPHPTDRKAGVRHSRELRQPLTAMPARESTPVGDSAPVTRILASAVQDRSAPYPHSWTDRSSTCPRGMQISRSRRRVDHVLTVEFFGKCRESKTPENINVFGGFIWLRGLDLNQRPSGYEFVK